MLPPYKFAGVLLWRSRRGDNADRKTQPLKEPTMFEIDQQLDPVTYRRETRRNTLVVALIFIALAMALASASVQLFGEPGADNFRWNLGGVIVGLLLSVAVVRLLFWSQPWMAATVYGWRLKRGLMSVTNVMHHVKAGVVARDPCAMKLLRFYHLGLAQMHRLDGNNADITEIGEAEVHRERMEAQGLETAQYRLDPAWIEAVKQHPAIS